MAKIHVLDKHTAELIAAGEVVERPASVIKELFENAVDAGASVITVEIKNGGVTYMRITDNGCGIAREDVPIAFLRHATSKVRIEEDLDHIGTLGFRGEALASVAAVSRLTMQTCADGDTVGTQYVIQGGEEILCEDFGCATGTTIVVENLFYNVPARMKFLKTDMGEGNAVSGVMDKLALSHPEISVHFIRDGKDILNTSGDGDLHGCVYSVLGREFASSLLPVDYTLNGIHVYGFCNRIEKARSNRTMQYFFINGRYVKTRTGSAALEQAFKGSIMVGRFPTCVLYLELPVETVDVNVHPTKIEVRFMNEKPIFDVIYHGIRSAIDSQNTRKEISFTQHRSEKPTHEQLYMSQMIYSTKEEKTAETSPAEPPTFFKGVPDTPVHPMPSLSELLDEEKVVTDTEIPSFPPIKSVDIHVEEDDAESDSKEETSEPELSPIVTTVNPDTMAVRFVGEIFKTYILAEMNGSLYLIDKHAAHERILYNKLRETEHTDSQQLLAPVSVSLTSAEQEALLNARDALEKAGYEIDEFGDKEILVRAVPMMLSGEDITSLMEEIAGNLLSGKQTVDVEHLDWLYHNTACRAAIKAGNHNQSMDLQLLAETVLHDDSLRTCPHGRPVCVELSQKEIEKQFGRIV